MQRHNKVYSAPRRCSVDTICLFVVASLMIVLNIYRWPTNDVSPLEPILYHEEQANLPISKSTRSQLPVKMEIRTSISDSEISEIERRFADRLTLLHKKCRERANWGTVVIDMPWVNVAKRCEVLEDYKVLYCEVNKAGSSSWNTLMAYLYNQRELLESHAHYKMQSILRVKTNRFKEIMKSEEFLKFFVVREPLSRLLSGYRNRIEDTSSPTWQRKHWAPLILKHTRHLKNAEMRYLNGTMKVIPTFEEFARYLSSQNPRTFDPHWIPIALECGVCTYEYTTIVHTETFLDDIRYIIKTRGLDKKIDMSLVTLNANKGKGNTTDLLVKYYSTLSPEVLQRIVNIYKEDFKLFGYDPTETLKRISPEVPIRF